MKRDDGQTATQRTSVITEAGKLALFFIEHPDCLPDNAPDPQTDAEAFTEWAKHHQPPIKHMRRVYE